MLRVLPPQPVRSFADYLRAGGGSGLAAARELGADGVVEHLAAAGLRGRGGAGFPTGTKWRTVLDYSSDAVASTVVVNAAEGEPGSFKDRIILRRNPYAVIEGALIAATTVGADRVLVALKRSFAGEVALVRRALADVGREGWADGIDLVAFEGPGEYLYGEETGLLEVIDGRPPFPRVAPPFRHGVEELSDDADRAPSRVVDASPAGGSPAPPTLVNNVETIANVPALLARGPAWFRSVGTDESPGTIVCTVTGCTPRAGVGEVAMGTPLRDVIDRIGGGPRPGRHIVAVMSGVANPVVPEDRLDTPVSYEAMQAAGSGLGAAGFIVFDDMTDFAAVAAGVSRFLAVESCGQCTPCKEDGLALARILDRVRRSDAREGDLDAIDDRLRTVTDSARCYLAYQHQRVVGSIVEHFGDGLRAHAEGKVDAAEVQLTVPIRDLTDERLVFDEDQARKQPDWTYDAVDSGKAPAARLGHAEGDPAVTPIPVPAVDTDEGAARHGPASPPHAGPVVVHGTRPESLDPDDPEARLYTSAPVETDDGTVVIQQQPVGKGNEEGSGEWPDPHTPPHRAEPGAP
jgi:NADH:ubiquinone oxidoreductase subunit F (NADH-binding)